MDIYEELTTLKKEDRACALATIVQAVGSSPQRAGAKMLVRDDGTISGTLGGGCIEEQVRQLSLLALQDRTTRTVPFDLTETESGLVCGGQIVIFIEPVFPDPRLVIIGAGHVGKALASVARFSGYRTTVIDDREEYANPAHIPDASEVIINDFADPLRGVVIGRETNVVIATRGHTNDLDALKAVLQTPAGYIGLVGSRRKKAILFGNLLGAGFPREEIERVIIPVGLPIGSVTPEEIAISIMAQIIENRRRHETRNRGNSSCGRVVEEDGAAEAAPPAR